MRVWDVRLVRMWELYYESRIIVLFKKYRVKIVVKIKGKF